jgi:hypothetical protein
MINFVAQILATLNKQKRDEIKAAKDAKMSKAQRADMAKRKAHAIAIQNKVATQVRGSE